MRLYEFIYDTENMNFKMIHENQSCLLVIGKNYGWWAISGLLLAFVNKVLLAYPIFTYCLGLLLCYNS